MDIATFEDRLDLYGAMLALWPEADRAAATALVASSGEARAMLAAMAEVESLLRHTSAAATAGAADATVARATRHRQETPTRRFVMRVGWGAAAAALLVVGLLVGGMSPPSEGLSPERIVATAFDAGGAPDVE